jgi:hypothetical protein
MMKRFVSMLLIGLAFVAFGTVVAHAQAVVIKDFSCNVFAGDCSTFVVSTENIFVQTSQQGGNCVASCHLTLPEGAPLPPGNKPAQCDFENTGQLCNTPCGVSDDWQEVITPSGEVSAVCHFHNNDDGVPQRP